MSSSLPTSPLTVAASIIALAAFTVYLLAVGETIFIPLVLAIFIAYLILALAHALQSVKVGTWTPSAGIALTLAVGVFLLAIAVLIQLVAGSVGGLIDAAPQYQQRLETAIAQANAALAAVLNRGQPITIAELLTRIDLKSFTIHVVGALQSVAGNTVQIFVYVAFLLLEAQTFDRKIAAMLPDRQREEAVRKTLQEIGGKIEAYVWVKTTVSLLTATCCFVALSLVGVDFAPFWALLLFILNFIPYIGSLIAVSLPSLFAALQFSNPLTGLIVLSVLASVQLVIDNLVEPRLAGKSLNISPIMMMLGLSTWGAIWGITGMVLSVPIMVMLMIVLAQFPQTRPLAILMSQRGEIR